MGFYNPNALKISSFEFKCPLGANIGYPPSKLVLQGSNDDSSYTQIGQINPAQNANWQSMTVSTDNFYKYFKLIMTAYAMGGIYGNQGAIGSAKITATYQTSGNETTKDVLYPCSHQSTKYSFSVSGYNGKLGDAYVYPKSASSFTLKRNGSPVTYFHWLTAGY